MKEGRGKRTLWLMWNHGDRWKMGSNAKVSVTVNRIIVLARLGWRLLEVKTRVFNRSFITSTVVYEMWVSDSTMPCDEWNEMRESNLTVYLWQW